MWVVNAARVPEAMWARGEDSCPREVVLEELGWVTHQGIAQGWFRRSAKGSRKQSPWEGKKLGCSLQTPGHPSSASSCSWGLKGGKGNSWAPCYRSVLFPAKRHGASSSKEINTPTGRPTKTSHLEYSITNAGPGHWEVENPLYERSLDLKGRGWTPSYTHQPNRAVNPMFVYQETTSTSVLCFVVDFFVCLGSFPF